MRAQFPKLKRVYELLGAGEKVAKCEIDLGHGYYVPMREVMYAWFRRWLQGVQSDLCPEPEVDPVEPERVWCFPDGKMPEGRDNVPSLAYAEGRRLAATYPEPARLASDAALREEMRTRLRTVLGFPEDSPPVVEPSQALPSGCEGLVVTTEPGIRVPMVVAGAEEAGACRLWLDPAGKASVLSRQAPAAGEAVAASDLRGVGESAWERATTVGVWDYQYFQNGVILGRPMLGMWVWDALQCLRALRGRFARVTVAGEGVMALVALLAAALDEGATSVTCEGLLAGYVYPEGFAKEHAMSTFVPGILKVGDVPQIAALVAPRGLHIAGAVDGGNRQVSSAEAFAYTRQAYAARGAEDALSIA